MPRDGNGVYAPLYRWAQDAANNVPMTPERFDAQYVDIANALNDLPLAEDVPRWVPAGTSPNDLLPGTLMEDDGTIYVRGSSATWIPWGAASVDLSPYRTASAQDTIDTAQSAALQANIDGKAAASHTHAIANVTGLQTALDALDAGKAAASHTHAIANVTGLQTALDDLSSGKAATSHTHAIANVTGLQAALDGKAATSHTHGWADLPNVPFFMSSDYASISAMVTAARAAGVRTCYVEPDDDGYDIAATIDLRGVDLIAVKRGTVLRLSASATRMFRQTIADTAGCLLDGFVIELQNNFTTYGIEVLGKNFTMRNCELSDDTARASFVLLEIGTSAENVLIEANELHNSGTLIRCRSSAANVVIHRNTFRDYLTKGVQIRTENSERGPIFFEHNVMLDPVAADPAVAAQPKQPFAVNIGAANSVCRRLYVRFNELRFSPLEPHKNGVVNRGTADAISFQNTHDSEIVGNRVTNSGELGINASLLGDDILIANNVVENCEVGGISVGTSASAHNTITVTGNVVKDAGQDRYNDHTSLALANYWFENVQGLTVTSNASYCTVAPPLSISAATETDPVGITTETAHGYTTGDIVSISGVGGMTQINGGIFSVVVASTTTFSLQTYPGLADVDGTAFGTYTSGGTVDAGYTPTAYLIRNCLGSWFQTNASTANTKLSAQGTNSFDWIEGDFAGNAALPVMTSRAIGCLVTRRTDGESLIWDGSIWGVIAYSGSVTP